MPSFRDAWFDLKSIMNIFSMLEMVDKYQVTFDSSKEDGFILHLPNKTERFKFKKS